MQALREIPFDGYTFKKLSGVTNVSFLICLNLVKKRRLQLSRDLILKTVQCNRFDKIINEKKSHFFLVKQYDKFQH